MSEQRKVNAVLLAGDKRASIEVKNDNKAFLPLKGLPLFIHVLKALKQSHFVGIIAVIGPSDRIKETLEDYTATIGGNDEIIIVEQRDNMIENFKIGYVATLKLSENLQFKDLRESEYAETPVLAVPCDIPLITPYEIDEFIIKSNMHDYDYSIGITSEKVLSYYHPSDTKPGIKMIYFHVREDLMRHNNLHLGRPLKFKHLDYVEKMYEWRYQTHILNALRMMFALLLVSWRFIVALKVFVFLQLSVYYDRHGHPKLSDHLRMHAPLDSLPLGIGQVIGARTQVVYTHFGGAAIDVDHDENLDVIEKMYDEWMKHQEKIKNQS